MLLGFQMIPTIPIPIPTIRYDVQGGVLVHSVLSPVHSVLVHSVLNPTISDSMLHPTK